MYYHVFRYIATHYTVLQCTTLDCAVLECIAIYYSKLQYTTVKCWRRCPAARRAPWRGPRRGARRSPWESTEGGEVCGGMSKDFPEGST